MSPTDNRIVAGIDYSLTSPAIAIGPVENNDLRFDDCIVHFLSKPKKRIGKFKNCIGSEYPEWSTDIERYEAIADWILLSMRDFKSEPAMVALEGYSMGSKGKVFHIAENTAILKQRLHHHGYRVTIVPPTVNKKDATGKGNASKEDMYAAFQEKTGVDLRTRLTPASTGLVNPVTDVVDAYYLARYAARLISGRIEVLPR